MVELVDTLDLGSSAVWRESSNLSGSIALTLVYKDLTSLPTDLLVKSAKANWNDSFNFPKDIRVMRMD